MSDSEKRTITIQVDPSKGGEARAISLTAERRREIASEAARQRWAKQKQQGALAKDAPKRPRRGTKMTAKPSKLPVAKHWGVLSVMDLCHSERWTQTSCYGWTVKGRGREVRHC